MAKKKWSNPGLDDDCWRSLYDPTEFAFVRRLKTHRGLLMQRGGFSENEATAALRSPKPEDKESAANWLRRELKLLEIIRPKVGSAPVLKGQALSELVIADLAITLLQYCDGAPGLNLVHLLGELLHVDRHRMALAETAAKKEKLVALIAALKLQGYDFTDRKLARRMSVSPTTIGEWRRSAGFKEEVEVALN